MDVISPLTVEKVVYGGQGLCRHEGKVIFVPFTIKGEKITAKIISSKKNFSNGICLHLIDKDPSRITPPCCHFGVCGGCQWQHMTYDKQLETKTDILKENLASLCPNIPLEVIGLSDHIWQYREHIKLSYTDGILGYHGFYDKNVFKIAMCPIFSTQLTELLKALEEALKTACINHGEIRLLKAEDSFIACIKIDHGQIEPLKSLLTLCQGVSVILNNHRHDFGHCELFQTYLGHKFATDIWSFMQNHRKMAELLYQHVIDSIPLETTHLIDLYCGAGILSILSALKGIKHIVGIELNPSSIACAKQNLHLSLGSDISFIAAPAEKAATYLKTKPDHIIVNPPREGLSDQMLKTLVLMNTKSICYVSCNPTTLARDLKKLKAHGYELTACKGFDLFPQTTHLETVCTIKKR